jgi:Protein of unknown function (DUF3667)
MTGTTLNVPADAAIAVQAPPAAPVPADARAAAPAECTNCGRTLAGEFCAECGQRAVRERLTVRGVAQQVAHTVLNLDRGILFTALELTRRPGDAVRDYVQGRRVRYTSPVKYFVLCVALTTFASTQLGVVDELAAGMVHGMGNGAPVTVEQASGFMSRWMTLFMALGVPFTAAVTRLLFRRAGMNYAEHLVLNLFLYAHQSLALALTLLAATFLEPVQGALTVGWMVLAAAHFAWSCTRFFAMRARRAVPLGVIGMILGTVLYLLFASFVVGVGVGIATAAAGG